MYEDLVKRLRTHNGWALNETLDEAADAIEKLSKLADAIPHVCECCIGCELEKKNEGCDNAFVLSPKRAMQHLFKPRWIPVSEQLPRKYHQVLCYGVNGMSIDYYSGESSVLGRPLFMVSEARVTHWMPLPEPPKEEEND